MRDGEGENKKMEFKDRCFFSVKIQKLVGSIATTVRTELSRCCEFSGYYELHSKLARFVSKGETVIVPS